ncbi:hypothetical protein [Planomicrobium sp. Y74]|uniref:hypothetical protein n=1 Tax=Planomicrobium sp. Y74 TaxID=2478977 RepID=UPI000EF4D9A9|nr:hypothetical protein [Planomicrobium sp. Y74]RLQ91949.1 hypothetical protein D9754_03955 [Planomicrobium sp. Y74]
MNEKMRHMFTKSMKLDLGKISSKKKWSKEAYDREIEFLCKDFYVTNNAWYRLSCGHIKSINRADVRRGRFGCGECKKMNYSSECNSKGLKYIEHYCEERQTIIVVECEKCKTIFECRASSVTHHKNVECQSCKEINWDAIANSNGFKWLKQIDSAFSLYECLRCKRMASKRTSDMLKSEVSCECSLERQLLRIAGYAKIYGFRLISKVDRHNCKFECVYCSNQTVYQIYSMKIGSVRCRFCNPKKSQKQTLIEKYLTSLGFAIENEVFFDGLIGKKNRKLRFDIGHFNNGQIQWLIEYDGIHHFEPTTYGGIDFLSALKKFKTQRKYDVLKNNFTKFNNIPLLRIAYNEEVWKEKINLFLQDFTSTKN